MLPKSMCALNAIPIKIAEFFKEVDKPFLKFIWRIKDAQIAKSILEMIREPGKNK